MWLQDGAHPQQWHRELFATSLHHRLPRFGSKRLKEEFAPLCGGAYPQNGVFPSGEPRSPSHSEEDPAFFRSTDPDSPRSAGRCGLPACLPSSSPPPPLAAPEARILGESRDPLCPPPPPVGFRRSTEPSFPGGRMGKPPESPQDGAEGCHPHQARPALRAPHLRAPRRHHSVLRRQRPALFQTSAFPGSGAAPPAPSRGVRGWEVPAGGPRGAAILLPSPRDALPVAQPSAPALRELPGRRREGEARRSDAEETEVPPASTGTGGGVLWQSDVTVTP